MKRFLTPSLLGLMALGGSAWAADPQPNQAREDVFIEAPPPPPILRDGEPIEPEVRIIEESPRGRVEEFSTGGRVYMIKVTPAFGPPYYYVDYDGDGQFAPPRVGGVPFVSPNQWLLFSW